MIFLTSKGSAKFIINAMNPKRNKRRETLPHVNETKNIINRNLIQTRFQGFYFNL